MAYWVGTFGNDTKDFLPYGNSNDTAYGLSGHDTIYGWYGNDKLYGGFGDDKLYGEYGNDYLYGGYGNDYLSGGYGSDYLSGEYGNDMLYGGAGYDKMYGGAGNDMMYGQTGPDDLYGGTGVDKMYGGTDGSADYFYFYTADTGDVYANKADTIYDFSNVDQIFLKGYYSYNATGTSAPADGQYSIWQKGSDWVVTYNSYSDAGYHDILVKGGDPHGDISFF